MRSPQEGYQYSNTVFKVWQHPDGLVQIQVGEGDIWLEYYGHSVTASVLGLYHGGLCGLCGDHNGDPSNDAGQTFTLPCPGRR
ncbi:hypothetical protein Cfor_12054 [Coptotermes formosanus]|uniref:VWFD domain-containing protein n=1 Tax=Coptotermes formosanus TaxID=36987 RepID=A0A6L2PQ83_COPFO|nr:hypothetical protein Cfor_12054 [Coptotermes formosanus]